MSFLSINKIISVIAALVIVVVIIIIPEKTGAGNCI